METVTNTQGKGANMGQAQQNRRALLIVEDDVELREFVARLLEDAELDTIECESAEAALATMLIRGRDVAMIFADIRLPGVMDGIDLAREVRLRWPFSSCDSHVWVSARRSAAAWDRFYAQAVAAAQSPCGG